MDAGRNDSLKTARPNVAIVIGVFPCTKGKISSIAPERKSEVFMIR